MNATIPTAAPSEAVLDAAVCLRVVRVLEGVWSRIRAEHPDVPEVVVTFASGTEFARVKRRGHYAPQRWQLPGVEARVDELFVAAERLVDGAEGVLATMLHEAAHGLARTRNIEDTSRQGRYHNERYRNLAIEVGLRCDRDKTWGWTVTTLSEETRAAWADSLAAIADVIGPVRHHAEEAERKPRKKKEPKEEEPKDVNEDGEDGEGGEDQDEDLGDTLGAIVTSLRERAGLSEEDLAERSGVAVRLIEFVEEDRWVRRVGLRDTAAIALAVSDNPRHHTAMLRAVLNGTPAD